MSRETWKATLLALSSLSVLACCFLAQWMAAVSKKSRLKLNKYYQRKKYEKDQLIQYICQEQLNYQYRNNQSMSVPETLTDSASGSQRPGAMTSNDPESNSLSIRTQPLAQNNISSGFSGNAGLQQDQQRGSVEGGERERLMADLYQPAKLTQRPLLHNIRRDSITEQTSGQSFSVPTVSGHDDEEAQAMLASNDDQADTSSPNAAANLAEEETLQESQSQIQQQSVYERHDSVYDRYNLAQSDNEDTTSERTSALLNQESAQDNSQADQPRSQNLMHNVENSNAQIVADSGSSYFGQRGLQNGKDN